MKKWIPGIILAVLIIVVVGFFIIRKNTKSGQGDLSVTQPIDSVAKVLPPPVLKFGLPVDSFVIENKKVRRNQNLSDILVRYGVSYQAIDQLARNAKGVFDVRRIKAGSAYSMFLAHDSLHTPRYFIYEDSPVDYYTFDLSGDSLRVKAGQKPVITKRKVAFGQINSSLWNAMTDNNLNPILAIDLSEIYAWTIDFFGVQRGDWFQIIYDENYVDGKSIGIGTIYAARFNNMGDDYYAFNFDQDGRADYFDEDGKSLRKAFLKAPLKYSRISSRFTNSRYHPILRIRRPHHGVDYAAPTGTPVHSIGDGVITRRGYQARGGGNYLYIKHNSVYTTSYMHLSRFAKGMHPGVRVKQGQLIGYVGMTGLATGPHLDFRVYKNGTAVDPLKVKAPPVEPVKKENMVRFEEHRDSLMNELMTIPIPGNETDQIPVADVIHSTPADNQ
ncbi:peptidoglycan DD-metalloendopeptidase family protein [Prolixibacter sp. NT017]|uniref:peptidoglycan DD-metalloendopeptidase family protein n=1 Tax=Prolixibacter sp. NT017 TaxID=2652390 RepID=UPI0012777F89|nr:peptidoglycan DD-metalloendopeptidase family protein [Prolixibacter sp. NT017]GET27545.1 peptidase M24 [Prolixibacter sp. NT017]